MNLQLEHLDHRTRLLMLGEIRRDIDAGRLYDGKYLAAAGKSAWPALLTEAAERHDAGWLTRALGRTHYWVTTVPYQRAGAVHYRKCPSDASDKLAEGEFNRFYMRALALRAIEDGLELEVVRVKHVESPRAESERKIGTRIDPRGLLADLRANVGIDTALGVPAGPNSGLGARLASPRGVGAHAIR